MPRSCLWPLLAWLLPLAGALGSRFHLWPWWIGFAICLIGALVSLILLVRLPWSRNRYANGFGALPLLLPLLFVVQALRMPLINDVSTDPYNPPLLRWAAELRTEQYDRARMVWMQWSPPAGSAFRMMWRCGSLPARKRLASICDRPPVRGAATWVPTGRGSRIF